MNTINSIIEQMSIYLFWEMYFYEKETTLPLLVEGILVYAF